jgi:signal transduction histidine kinase
MESSAVQVTVGEPMGRVQLAGAIRFLRVYYRPLLALLALLPLVGGAAFKSLRWLDATFPGFLLMENAVVPSVSGLTWPQDKGVLFHSQIVAVNGRPVSSSADVDAAVTAKPLGSVFTYTVRKGGETTTVSLSSQVFTLADYLQVYGILLLIATMSLTVGVVVGFMQPATTQARLYLLLSVVACVWSSSAVFLHQPGLVLLTGLYFVAETFFPAVLTHLALHFPAERRFSGLQRLWPVTPYLMSTVLATAVLSGFFRQPPTLWALHATYLYTATSFVFAILAMLFAYWENREPRARLRVKAVFPNFVLAGTLTVFAFTNNAAAGGDFPMQLGVLLVPLLYLSVAYAIAKHDLFDIDRFVRQSFVYGLLSLIVITAYALVLVVPARFVPTLAGDNQALLGMGFVLLLAVVLDPLRGLVQRIVDRAFYRSRLDYRATISSLSQAMTTLLNLREVVSQVTRVVTGAMHLESTALCVFEGDTRRSTLWWHDGTDEVLQQPAIAGEVDFAAVLRDLPREFDTGAVAGRLQAPLQALIAGTGATVVLQLLLGGHPTGLLLLGRKRSGQPFTSDDIAILRTLANQTAIAVQNARSYAALEQLTRDKDRLYQESLRHQRNLQLLSRRMMEVSERTLQRVAHELHDDLGQGLTSIKMELGLIERSLPDDSAIRPPLAEARTQVGTLLQSVRQLSQLLRPAVLDDLGLVAAMQSYVTRFGQRTGLTIRLHCPSAATRFPAPIEVALYRVTQEALTNIARHAEAHRVDITLGSSAAAVHLRIVDDGRGFDANQFLQSPPSGHGMGVLGMRERVATYGGHFDIRSQPGHGTTVELSISLDQPIPKPDDEYAEDSRLAG